VITVTNPSSGAVRTWAHLCSSTPITSTPSNLAGPADSSSALVAATAMSLTVSQERPSSRATAATVALSSISRRKMNVAQRRVVDAPGRASRLVS
jgi:hypothetical protein